MTLTAQIQPTTILLATDGSPHAQAAVQGLVTLSLPSESRVVVLAVTHLLHIARRADLYLRFREHEAREIGAALRQAVITLMRAGVRAEATLCSGPPADVIMSTAQKIGANLIVMGACSDTVEPTASIGSVAHKVVKCAPQPVLVVRSPARIQRLLFAVDGSSAGDKALDFLTRWPWPVGVTVTVLHVRSAVAPPRLRRIPVASEEIEEQTKAQAIVERAVGRLHAANLPADGQVAVGETTTEILRLAQRVQTDLILVGTRRLSALQRFLLGSVSRGVVRHVPCSVLVVR